MRASIFHILVFLQVGNIAVSINGMEKSVSCQSGRLRTWYLALPPLPRDYFGAWARAVPAFLSGTGLPFFPEIFSLAFRIYTIAGIPDAPAP